MQAIFVGSTGNQPGQTLATWALVVRLKEKGLKVGFLKPYGLLGGAFSASSGSSCDPDVLLMREILGFEEPDGTICPITVSENLLPGFSGGSSGPLIEKIRESFQRVSAGKDVVVIMGAKEIFFGGGLSELPDSALVKEFDASVLLVDRYQKDPMTLYSFLSLNSFLDGRVKSAIMNHVPPDKVDHVKGKLIPFLQEKGLKSIVPVPEDLILAAQTVDSLAGVVGGQIVTCPEKAGNLVATLTIGSKPLEGPLAIFKQVYNKIILIDLSLGELHEKSVAGIMLTGGKPPSEILLRVARDRSIPLVLTRADTFQVMETLDKVKPPMGIKDEFRVRRFLRLIDQESDGGRWVEALF
jgi:BioD-like phosphotransacetylase family protein